MGRTTVFYYTSNSGDNPLVRFIDSLEKRQQVKILRLIMQIQDYGLNTVIPHTKKLTGTPFWELRVLGKDSIRVVYVTNLPNSILLLHGFIKKTQKTPEKELKIAFSRYKEWQKYH